MICEIEAEIVALAVRVSEEWGLHKLTIGLRETHPAATTTSATTVDASGPATRTTRPSTAMAESCPSALDSVRARR